MLSGNFGLERETLRVSDNLRLSQRPHPFSPGDERVVRDFCENQTEINTGVHKTSAALMEELDEIHQRIVSELKPTGESLWIYSNPPFISGEDDIPIARYLGDSAPKTTYREYLATKYGKYKMTFSGIHFNYSFSGDLLRKNYELHTGKAIGKDSQDSDFQSFSDALYLDLAQNCLRYGWLIVALTAASPLIDSSYYSKGSAEGWVFSGMASVRCSESGYWNFFVPTLDYSDLQKYVDSIERYVDTGIITAPSELYYPIRLKPRGENQLPNLRTKGINHIELRSVDLNPLSKIGIDVRDVDFMQYFLVYLASIESMQLSDMQQIQCIQNFKSAAHFNIEDTKILNPDGSSLSIVESGLSILHSMRGFYQGVFGADSREIIGNIDYQIHKLTDPGHCNYARIIKEKGVRQCANFLV